MEIRFETRKPLRVAFVRHVGPYQECGIAWEKLTSFAARQGLLTPEALRIGIGHDSPDVTPAAELRYDACLTVHDQFQPTGEIGVQELAGGEYAVVAHRGPYAGLPDAYRWIFGEWLRTSGRTLRSDPFYEVYVSDPHTTPPDDLITEICLPLKS